MADRLMDIGSSALSALANRRQHPAVTIALVLGIGLPILVEGPPRWATQWFARGWRPLPD